MNPHATTAPHRPLARNAGHCALAALALVTGLGTARAADLGDAANHGKKPVVAAKVAAEKPADTSVDKTAEKPVHGKPAARSPTEPADGSLTSRLKAAMADPKHAKGELVIDAATLAGARTTGSAPAVKVAVAAPTHAAATAGHDTAPAVAGRARARAAALAGHDAPARGHGADAAGGGHGAHWAYEGENGPQAWAKLKPEFNVCAIGKRQSPIHIEDSAALPGPAEPLQLAYRASSGSVVNNGHTIQVDLEGDNTLNIRGTTYRLVQFHFHHPAEEKVNHKGFAMVAHLVHKSDDGKLAVVAVLMDPGAPSPLIEKVWTHMPLDTADRVRLPVGLIDMNELLPKDQRYYQFIGSLTTPPCTEGVLWLVLKQPVTLARDQLRLFAQQFPNNARPVQALNGRTVREAQ
jgi:carbonic anhydrase